MCSGETPKKYVLVDKGFNCYGINIVYFYVWSDLLVVFRVRPIVIAVGPQPQLKESNIEVGIINRNATVHFNSG